MLLVPILRTHLSSYRGHAFCFHKTVLTVKVKDVLFVLIPRLMTCFLYSSTQHAFRPHAKVNNMLFVLIKRLTTCLFALKEM